MLKRMPTRDGISVYRYIGKADISTIISALAKYQLYFGNFPPIYRQKYRLSVSVNLRTNKISVIGNRPWSNIGNQLSAKFNRYAIPDAYQT